MPSTTKKTCAFCGLPPRNDEAGNRIKMKSCSRCKSVYYHDMECQKKHWRVHKKACGTPKQPPAKSNNRPQPAPPPRALHRSMTAPHQDVARRFKELRSQGLSTQEAMKRARDECEPSSGTHPDARKQGAKFGSIRFDSIRFDTIRYDSIRYDSILLDAMLCYAMLAVFFCALLYCWCISVLCCRVLSRSSVALCCVVFYHALPPAGSACRVFIEPHQLPTNHLVRCVCTLCVCVCVVGVDDRIGDGKQTNSRGNVWNEAVVGSTRLIVTRIYAALVVPTGFL